MGELRNVGDTAQSHAPGDSTTAARDRPPVSTDVDGLLAAMGGDGIRELLLDGRAERLAAGERVGDFTIIRRLGGGGMGEVFLARQDAPRRDVALKVLHPECLSDAGIRRLRAEATLLDRARHPSIVAVYAAGSVRRGDGPAIGYLAMELVEGGVPITVAQRRGALPIEGTLRLFLELCEAVAHAHRNGVVHLDLKPTNALVSPDGRVKLIDFGLARAADGVVPQTDCPSGATGWIGTYEYMAPEQFERTPTACDARADVYSLGVLLYELLTGERPHNLSGLSPFGIGRKLSQTIAPDLRTRRPDAPPALARIVAKCLEPLADMRYADAAAICADLHHFNAGGLTAATSLRPHQRLGRWLRIHRRAVLTTSVVATGTILFGAGVLRWQSSQREAQIARSRLHAAHLREASAAMVRGELVLASLLASRVDQPLWEQRAFLAIPSRPLLDVHADGPILAAGLGGGDRVLIYSEGGRELTFRRLDAVNTGATLTFATTVEECRLEPQRCAMGIARLSLRRAASFQVDPPKILHEWSADSVAIAPSGDRYVTAWDGSLTVASLIPPGLPVLQLELPVNSVDAIAWSSEDDLYIAADAQVWRTSVRDLETTVAEGKGPRVRPPWQPVAPATTPLRRTVRQLFAHHGELFRVSVEAGLECLGTESWAPWPDASIGEAVVAAEISPSGTSVALGTTKGSLLVMDLRTREVTCNHSIHAGPVARVGWARSSAYIYSAADDGHIRIWPSTRDRYCPRSDSPSQACDRIDEMATSSHGDIVALASIGAPIKILRVRPTREMLDEVSVTGALAGLALRADGLSVAWCEGGDLHCQSVASRDDRVLRSAPATFVDLAWREDWLYTLRVDGTLECLSPTTALARWSTSIGPVVAERASIVRVSDEYVVVQTGSVPDVGLALSTRSGRQLSIGRFETSEAEQISAIEFHNKSRLWYGIMPSGALISNQEVSRVGAGFRSDSAGPCIALTFTPDESRLIAITTTGFPIVFDPETLEMSAWIAPAPVLAAVDFAFAEKNQVLTVASSDGRIRQFNAPSPFRQPPYVWRPTFASGQLRFERVFEDDDGH